ncbi:TIGR03086 family metal-binding protein [Klenkia sp. PcliD-1-E]|uniref:TIGR03086 family metal-binding protein n=1 Tax=Klenkia sp. PcliD-1-E TaxID=2954492 RepID=UPI002097169F|nr:TIGR03086 family metal-binding protein [Klenkia sp. PcliD-1-E]MCO7222286.1 TIGR03086 family metal-binding protein [Klenkia sp. PcliD-1-E]
MDSEHARLLALFQRAQAQVTDLVDAVEREQWDAVALPGWDVADLVAHLVAGQRALPGLLAGRGDDVPSGTEDLLAGDPLGSWEDAADTALTALAQPGVLDGVVLQPSGVGPAADHLAALTTELTVHAWDLARATGADTRLDAELVDAGLATVQRLGTAALPGPAGPPVDVPGDADPLVRLLALTGRRA